MSKYAVAKPEKKDEVGRVRNDALKFNVKETDWLLKVLMDMQFIGRDVEIVHSVMTKLVNYHKDNINNG